MNVTLKLFALLADHLPPESRSSHRLELDVVPGTTVLGTVRLATLPPRQLGSVALPRHRADITLDDCSEA